MSEVKSRKKKGAILKRLVENKFGLKPTIQFGNNKAEFNPDTEAAANNIVHIKVKVDPLGDKTERKNIMTKSFFGIQTFNRNSATVIFTTKSLNCDIYSKKGLAIPLDA